jgi:Protein of unknown function (DUF3431)
VSDIDLVIAHYNEDLSWVSNVTPGLRSLVYHKGSGSSGLPGRQLPNVGREAHTYLHHIVTCYEELSPVTVFCQGHPFDHCSNFHAVLKELASEKRQNLELSAFRWLGFVIDWDDAHGQRLFQNWSKNESRDSLDLTTFCRKIFPLPDPAPFVFYPGAQFVVTRQIILSRSRSFYEKALSLSVEFPHAAHCFERIWDRIFGANGIPVEYRNRELPIYLKPIKRLKSV